MSCNIVWETPSNRSIPVQVCVHDDIASTHICAPPFPNPSAHTHIRPVFHCFLGVSHSYSCAVTQSFSPRIPTAQLSRRTHMSRPASITSNPHYVSASDIPAPKEGLEGRWVTPRACTQRQSFGVFQCFGCNKRWFSARAQKHFKQGCQGCNNMYFPLYMWQNSNSWSRLLGVVGGAGDGMDSKLEGPHDSARCGACAAGRCGVSAGYGRRRRW